MKSTIGSRIHDLRKLAGMSQEELGRRVGVQRAAINKYEKGSVTNIPIQTVERIANTFDVSPTYLMGWTEDVYDKLAIESRVIQGVKYFYGSDAVELLETYTKLSNTGRKRLCLYADDLYQVYGLPE